MAMLKWLEISSRIPPSAGEFGAAEESGDLLTDAAEKLSRCWMLRRFKNLCR